MIELILCAAIWGASFVAQKLGSGHFGPFTLNGCRELLAGAFLFGCVCLRDRFSERIRSEMGTTHLRMGWNRATVVGGVLSGFLIFAAELAQQLGVERTTPGIAAFLTTNYVLLIPVFGACLGRRAGLNVWTGVVLALAGAYLLCCSSSPSVFHPTKPGTGEALVLLCAAFFAVQMMIVERFIRRCDMLRFSMLQVTVAGFVNLPFVFLPGELSRLSWNGFLKGVPAVIFLGILSSGVAYFLQNRGQSKVPAALASIVLSFEGVFATLFGWLVLGDGMSSRQLAGCGLVLCAVLASQLLSSRGPRRNDVV